jgi:hypothetical protein
MFHPSFSKLKLGSGPGILFALLIVMSNAAVHAEGKNVLGKTFVVTSTTDEVDANIGERFCQ